MDADSPPSPHLPQPSSIKVPLSAQLLSQSPSSSLIPLSLTLEHFIPKHNPKQTPSPTPQRQPHSKKLSSLPYTTARVSLLVQTRARVILSKSTNKIISCLPLKPFSGSPFPTKSNSNALSRPSEVWLLSPSPPSSSTSGHCAVATLAFGLSLGHVSTFVLPIFSACNPLPPR